MSQPKFDVFLSHKNLSGSVETQDAHLAREIYAFLTAKGLQVFLSGVSLRQLGRANFKKAIDDALDAAEVLVAVGTSRENLTSAWVTKECDSFENDILSGRKPTGRILTYLAGVDVNSLPRTLRDYQVILHHPPTSYQELFEFITGRSTEPSEAPAGKAAAKASIAPVAEIQDEEEIVSQWTEAGAFFDQSLFSFAFNDIQPGVIAKLPPPSRPFTLHLYGPSVTAAVLKELRPLKNLQTLCFNDPHVTDAGLKKLTGLKSLQGLVLTDTSITDAGLKDLARIKSLERLELERTPITDAGLKELAVLKKLQTLYLSDTQVTDAGLTELARFKGLSTLYLSGTKMTDAGLKVLAGLENLRDLNVSLTPMTDAGLAQLAGFPSLRTLNVAGTKVTPAGIKEFALRKQLRCLYLGSTQISGEAENELHRLCPGLTIYHIPTVVLSY